MARAMLTVVIMANEDQLPALDPAQLETVTGGVTGGGSDPNAQVTAMLQQLISSIGDLAHNQGGGNNQFMQMLPIIMMMRSRQQAPAPAPVAAPPPGDGWVRVS